MISLPTPIPSQITNAITNAHSHAFLQDDFNNMVTFNVLSDESDTDNNEVTNHAIESGSPVSDHVIGRPKQLNLNIILSDDDILFFNPPSGLSDLALFETISERLQTLWTWNNNKTLLTYCSYTQDYADMVIESIIRRQTLEFGSGIGISIILKQLNIVDSGTTGVFQQTNNSGVADKGKNSNNAPLQSQAFTQVHSQ